MDHPEEKARQEGIRLLEVHVKLLREARAALRSHSITSMEGTSNNQKGGERRLLDEIEKLEQKIKTWQKAYEDEYLQGNNIWDIIRKEEAEQNTLATQKIKEEKEEEEEKEEGRMTDYHAKKLKDIEKCNTENVTVVKKEEEKDQELEEEQITQEKEQKACLNKQCEIDKGHKIQNKIEEEKEILNQESNVKLVTEKEERKETMRPAENEGRSRKRLMEETDEEEEENIKKRKVSSPDGSRQVDGYRVLVQNLPLTVQYNDFRNYFSQFGNVNKVFLRTGSGCGFVIYESEPIADLVCTLQHQLGEQEVRVVKDAARPAPLPCPEPSNQDFEVFVFGVPPGTDPQVIRSALASFGPVASVTQPTGKNYAFVGFESESGKEAALQARSVTFNNVTVIIRKTRTYSEEGKASNKAEAAKEAAVTTPERPKKGYQVFVFGVNIALDLYGFKLGLAKFGTVVSAYMPEDKNYAFVGFETEEGQQAALDAGFVNLPYGRAVIKPVLKK